MNILYIDIDSLRPDHLSCYGYHRRTSPNIDSLAAQGIRFENVYVSDAPCLPSRTALWSGRCGFHTGVIDHGGRASQRFIDTDRGFQDSLSTTSWMSILQRLGFHTATISTFGQRHSAWHWYAGYNEVHNLGTNGFERADAVTPIALDWVERNGNRDRWFLHVNLWDPHTPYDTPVDYGNPFADTPLPAHITEAYWQECWNGYGPHSPQELNGFRAPEPYSAQWDVPQQLDTFEQVRWWIDHYDIGIHYADYHIGKIIDKLGSMELLDDTLIMISADHGENLGELNVWGDHQTADAITCHVPLIVYAPQLVSSWHVDTALHYHFDWAATLIELVGGTVPQNWDGIPFTGAFKAGKSDGREYVVTSQGAWSCQRGVRFDVERKPYMLLRTYHDGYKMLDDVMLFDIQDDPHERYNLADDNPELVQHGFMLLEKWYTRMMKTSQSDVDPMMTVLRSGGSYHTRGELPAYMDRLRNTGRVQHAETLARKHPAEME